MGNNTTRRGDSHSARSTCGTPRLSAVLLAAALCVAAPQASRAAESAAALPAGAQLTSARGEAIGAVSGRTTSFDANANMIGAYGVISARGYFADVLPSGALGQVLSLVYASADCSGAAAIEQSSVVGGPLPVPGYAFAFGVPVQTLNVPAGASLRELAVASERQRTRDGYSCVAAQKRALVYPITTNDVDVSGFADHYAGPLRVQVVAAMATQANSDTRSNPRSRAEPIDESAAGADVPPDTPECAAGCYTPYLGDHICESECANSLCGFDAGDCSVAYIERAKKHEATLCAATCEQSSIGDGFCDSACNVSSCNFDQGDCKRK